MEGASVVNGDVINVSAGSLAASSTITVPDAKTLSFVGAGSGSTIVTVDSTVAVGLNLGYSNSSVTGFTFQTSAVAADNADQLIYASGSGGTGRIHHNALANTNSPTSTSKNVRCIFLKSATSETTMPSYLIDHNTFTNCRYAMDATTTRGGAQWYEQPAPIGAASCSGNTCSTTYVEDNTFNHNNQFGNCIEMDYGGRVVARFNTVTGCSFENHENDVGTSNGGTKGGRLLEAYANDFTIGTSPSLDVALRYRSGGGLAWGNTFHGYDATAGALLLDQSGNRGAGGCGATSPNATNGLLGSGSSYPASGWPCFVQTGFGQFQSTYSTSAYADPLKDPLALFLNYQGATIVSPNPLEPGYFTNAHEYQLENAAFTGASGTGVGTALPATCTTSASGTPGTAATYYWKTDEGTWNVGTNPLYTGQGRLYKCTATNTWTLWYTPYTYPHPLQGGGGGGGGTTGTVRSTRHRGVPGKP